MIKYVDESGSPSYCALYNNISLLGKNAYSIYIFAKQDRLPIMSTDHRRNQRGAKGAMPPRCLENIVILCFERRFSKQNSVIRLKSNILPPPKFWAGYVTATSCYLGSRFSYLRNVVTRMPTVFVLAVVPLFKCICNLGRRTTLIRHCTQ